MSDNAVNKSISMPMEVEEKELGGEGQFSLAVQELGENIFQNYPDKTSNITEENLMGIIRCNELNDYMQTQYGFRYTSLDTLVQEKMNKVMSKGGFGIQKFIEVLQAIQAQFQQVDVPTLGQKMLRR